MVSRSIIMSGKVISLGTVLKSDLEDITAYMNDRDVRTFLRDPARIFYIENEEEWYNRIRNSEESKFFAIVENSREILSGLISLHSVDFRNGNAYIAYSIKKEFWNRGFATEAVSLAIGYAFRYLNLRKLHSTVMEPNVASKRVLEKNGFVESGRFRKNGYIPGNGFVDEIYLELMNEGHA